jgi:hypothetical protein
MCRYGTYRSLHLKAIEHIASVKGLKLVYPSQFALDNHSSGYHVVPPNAKKLVAPLMKLQNIVFKPKKINVARSKCKIAFLGVAADHKGWQEFSALTKDPRLSSSFEWFYFGTSEICIPIRKVEVGCNESYDSMAAKLRENGIDLAFIWTLCPETFCFTAHEAIAAGCHILTVSTSGNVVSGIPSRLRTVYNTIDQLHANLAHSVNVKHIEFEYASTVEVIESSYSFDIVGG